MRRRAVAFILIGVIIGLAIFTLAPVINSPITVVEGCAGCYWPNKPAYVSLSCIVLNVGASYSNWSGVDYGVGSMAYHLGCPPPRVGIFH